MLTDVRTKSILQKFAAMLLSIAMIITMMPLLSGAAYAADGAPLLVVEGNALSEPVTFTDLEALQATGIEVRTTSFHTLNSNGKEEDLEVEGVRLEDLINCIGLEGEYEVGSVTALASDGEYQDYTPEQIFNEDLQGNKAMFVWTIGGKDDHRAVVGQYSAGEANKSSWCKYTIKIVVNKKIDLTVTGDALAQDAEFALYDLKNTTGLDVRTTSFHTLNSNGKEEDLEVEGVRLEDLINCIGLEGEYEVGSVTALASDGEYHDYTLEQIFNEDLQGNKAMFVWTIGGKDDHRAVAGQYSEGEVNKGSWCKNTIKIVVNKKIDLTVTGDALAQDAGFALYDLKNTTGLDVMTATFNTLNNYGTAGSSTVEGVRIEDIINIIGLKDGTEIGSIEVFSQDSDKAEVYTADEILNEDLDGNKAMFVWTIDSKTDIRTVLGQFENNMVNKPRWVKNACKIVVNRKPDPQPEPEDKPAPAPAPSAKKGDKVAISAGTVTVLDTKANTVAFTKAKNKKSVSVPSTVKVNGKTFKVTQVAAGAFKGSKIRTVTIGANVNKIAKNAFKGSKATKLIVKTKKLKKASAKGSLKGSKVKTVQVKIGKKSVNKKYVKSYKKIFTKKNAGKKVTVK